VNFAALPAAFRERFSGEPRLFRAPGRVNLIGEHTDYNDGFVMPAAIGFSTWAAAAARDGGLVRIHSANNGESFEFSLEDAASPRGRWTDYVQGVAVMLRRDGFAIRGADLLIAGDVPLGAGLSSSAALLVSTARALLGVAHLECDPARLARLCQRAESEFAGIRCGVMDQFASIFGREDHAVLLDCRSLDYEYLPLPAGVSLVVANTMVRHQHAAGEYNRRRAECEEAAACFGVSHLREATPEMFDDRAGALPEAVRRRARHVIAENARALEAAAALRDGDLVRFGLLMDASHASLRDDYEVSCDELDRMVALAKESPGVYGARMTGGGFGGCAIAMVRDADAGPLAERLREGYRLATGVSPAVYLCRAAAGASEIVR
jgi:galactokinase